MDIKLAVSILRALLKTNEERTLLLPNEAYALNAVLDAVEWKGPTPEDREQFAHMMDSSLGAWFQGGAWFQEKPKPEV
jgi:hypothetical protein